jgi:hypothetical protein
MRFTLIIHLVVVFTFAAHSQDSSCLNKYVQRTIFQYGSGFALNRHELRYRELKFNLNKFDDAAAEYSSYRKGKRTSFMIAFAGLTMGVVAANIEKNSKSVAGALWGGTAISVLIIPFTMIGATNHLQKAVWLYNKHVMAY